MSTRPILVVGGSGQLARCLVESAAQRQTRLVAVGRPEVDIEDTRHYSTRPSRGPTERDRERGRLHRSGPSRSEPARAFAINRDGAERLAVEARKSSVPFIHISTDYVFDGRKLAAYTEEDPTVPISIYGRSKLEGEEAVRKACPAALVLRTSWIYSTYEHNFVTTMLRLAQTRDDVCVVDDQWGSPTSGNDLANAILDILRRVAPDNFSSQAGVYHLSAQGETNWHGFASAIFASWAKRGRLVPRLVPIRSEEYPTAASRPANSRLDCGKIKRQFGISLPPWQRSLDACLDRLMAETDLQRC